jgi:Auxiliary Activity family 9 (formerly GH61)
VSRVCPAKAGSTLTFEFREHVEDPTRQALDPGHPGPCSVWMKKVDSAIASNNAAGDGWFKIWEEGYDEAAGKWCTNKMIDNNGHISVNVPSDIEGGYYLVRPELLALHAAVNNPPDPQFYVGCAQIYLDSAGTAKPATINIPENYVNMDTPGVKFNVYNKPMALPYPLFGPKPYSGGGSPASPAPSAATSANPIPSPSPSPYINAAESTDGKEHEEPDASADDECDAEEGDDTGSDKPADVPATPTSTSAAGSSPTPVANVKSSSSPSVGGQTEGLKPEGCIMENGNWCGFEVPSYTDENGCWSSSAQCWEQSKTCYEQTPPTGAKNCDLFGGKCNHLDDTCNAKHFTGPPDAGKDLTPTPPDLAASSSRKLMALVKKHESHVMRRAYRARAE